MKKIPPEAEPLFWVEAGDWLLLDPGSRRPRLRKVTKRTALRVYISETRWFRLCGAGVNGFAYARIPTEAEVAEMLQRELSARNDRALLSTERQKIESQPRWIAAECLMRLGALTTDQLAERYDEGTLVQAAKLLGLM